MGRRFNLKIAKTQKNENGAGSTPTPRLLSNVYSTPDGDGFFDDDDEVSISMSIAEAARKRERFDTELFVSAADDGNVYTGQCMANIVYRIIKINKWDTKKERTMIVHKMDRTVRLFDDKRRCHSEYPLSIMATLDIINAKQVEVVFKIDQKPTQFVLRSHIDLWDFVEQIRSIAPNEIMVSDRRMKNRKTATITSSAKAMPMATTKDMLFEIDNDQKTEELELAFDEELDVNPNVLRYSVLRLIRSKAKSQQVTWRQHRRCIYLDLEKKIVRMMTLGLHIKDYSFADILLLEKSYLNAAQLRISCKQKSKMKEYWYEFVSPQARAEFVGRLYRALPSTNSKKQIPQKIEIKTPTAINPHVIKESTLSPRRSKKKKISSPVFNDVDLNGLAQKIGSNEEINEEKE